MFDRIISIDCSGAGVETKGVDLRVTLFDGDTGECRILNRRHGNREFHSWTRSACREWLIARLNETPRTLVACDFGFGLPWGADSAVFDVVGWRETDAVKSRFANPQARMFPVAVTFLVPEKLVGGA